MFGKIVRMGLVVTLLLVLVGGTVYILARPSDAQAGYPAQGSTDGAGYGGGRRVIGEDLSCDVCDTESGRGVGSGAVGGYGQGSEAIATEPEHGARVQDAVEGRGRAAGSAGGSQGQGTQNNSLWDESTAPALETIVGTVIESGSEILVGTEEGEEVLVGMGQAFYREEQGFEVLVGDEVEVQGFHEDGEFKASVVIILGEDGLQSEIVLRDATGRPMWSGRGNNRNRP